MNRFIYLASFLALFNTSTVVAYTVDGQNQDQYYSRYDNENPILEYVFTMMYLQTGMTQCSEVITKPRGGLINTIDMIFSMIGNNIKLETLNKEYVIAKLNAAYDYCQAHPEEMFGKALMETFGLNLPNSMQNFDSGGSSFDFDQELHNSDSGDRSSARSPTQQRGGTNGYINENTGQSNNTNRDEVKIIN